MSEMIKEFNKGDLLHIDNDGKAQWGYPEGYPWKEGMTIEWDGNIEGLDAVDNAGGTGGMLYRVSDVVLSNEQIKTGIIKTSGGVETSISDYWDTLVNAGVATDDIVYTDFVVFVRKDNASIEGIEFKKTGVYFIRVGEDSATYTQKFENKTIHPISSDFLPLATKTAVGTVKQAAAVTNVTAAPTAEEFNALLKSLRDAGILATE